MNKSKLCIFMMLISTTAALGQSSPGLIKGQVPSAADWNSYFASKQDNLGYAPVNKAGDIMNGRLVTCTLSTINPPGFNNACFNLPPGTAPAAPTDGDLWMTNTGLYAQIGGSTVLINSTQALAAIAYSGSASDIVAGTIPPGHLNAPSVADLGGVHSKVAIQHFFVTGISTSGDVNLAQPGANDISGLAASAITDTTNAANISSGTLPAGRLPSPTLSTLGGVEAVSGLSHNFLTGLGTDGLLTRAQPSAADISGLAASATTDTTNAANITSGKIPAGRLPNPAASTLGGIKSLASTTHNFLTGLGTDGILTSAQPNSGDIAGLAASATIDTTNAANITSGTLSAARLPSPGATTLGGVKSLASTAHNFLTGLGTDGGLTLAQPNAGDISGLAPSATIDTTNAANITSGTFGYGHCPPATSTDLGCVYRQGPVAGIFLTGLNPDGSFSGNTISCATLTDATASCSTDTTNAANIISGTLSASRLPLPTGASLGGVKSSSGGAHQFSTGINISGASTFAQPACSDLSDAKAACNSNAQIELCQSGVAALAPNNTSENVIAQCTISANSMGINGCVRIETTWTMSGNTNSKTFRVKFQNTEFLDASTTNGTVTMAQFSTIFCNRGVTGSQVGAYGLSSVSNGFAAATPPTGTIDTTIDRLVNITAQKSSGTDTIQLERFAVFLQPAS